MEASTPAAVPAAAPAFGDIEVYRRELTRYCYRMLGSPFEAEDAVQDTLLRAWRGSDRFEGRASLRSWLYRIATNVCLDMLRGRERRARPLDLGPARAPLLDNLALRPEAAWLEPVPDDRVLDPAADPAELAVARESLRLAVVAALQHLPPRQRAVLILCESLGWKAAEAAELLDATVASVNSALQRARATLAGLDAAAPGRAAGPAASSPPPFAAAPVLDPAARALLDRYVAAFQAYDMAALTDLIREDASQSMPPYDLWLHGRADVLAWWFGPGSGCAGSRVVPAPAANGLPAFGQYKPAEGGGFVPWALQVVELGEGDGPAGPAGGPRIQDITFFLDTARLFPLFGLPARLDG